MEEAVFKEFQGKSLDEAIQEACAYFAVPREKMEIEIVQDAKNGIFGLVGARKAIIRARRAELKSKVGALLNRPPQGEHPSPRRKNEAPSREVPHTEAAQEKTPKRRVPRKDPDTPAFVERGRTPVVLEDEDSIGNRVPLEENLDDSIGNRIQPEPEMDDSIGNRIGQEGKPYRRGRFRQDTAQENWDRDRWTPPQPRTRLHNEGFPGESAPFEPARTEEYRRPRSSRKPDQERRPVERRTTERPQRYERVERVDVVERATPAPRQDTAFFTPDEPVDLIPFSSLDPEKLTSVTRDTISCIIGHILGETPVTVALLENCVDVRVECGEDFGLLIGREGQTLAALQYITSRLVSRQMEAPVRVQIDVGDYRERQDDRLRDLALALADRVRATGRPCSTRPMSSYHRRLVHMALQDSPDVQTRSFGEGALKRVIIQRRRQG